MPKPMRTPTPKLRPRRENTEDLARVDAFRTDEDTGGAAAPPLRPRREARRSRTSRPNASGRAR